MTKLHFRSAATITAMFIVTLEFCAPARCQTNTGATDNQMYAGYCKGVLGARASLAASVDAKEQRQLLELETRFSDYLSASGVWTNQNSTALTGLMTAINRGKGDVDRCWQHATNCPAVSEKCPVVARRPREPLGSDLASDEHRIECMTQVMKECRNAEPACTKIDRCEQPDKLPF